MSSFYPIMLKIEGKEAVVIGGGKVAERKVNGLLNANANVTIISPSVTEPLQTLVQEKKCRWLKKEYEAKDVENAFIIIAATDSPKVNLSVHSGAKDFQLINIADHPEMSNFHVPSIIRRGKLYITVSTSGASPLLGRKIKKKLEQDFGPEYSGYLDFLSEIREWILENIQNPEHKKIVLEEITKDSFSTSPDKKQVITELINQLNQLKG